MAIRHGRVSIALHALREAEGPALLCLHAVGGSARDFREAARLWPGPVHALDFSGHGDSGPLRGGWARSASVTRTSASRTTALMRCHGSRT